MTACRMLVVAFVTALAALPASPVSSAEFPDPPYVRYMPTPRQVIEKTRGSDEFDTAARRYATLEQLVRMLGVLEGPREFRGPVSAGEARLRSEYGVVAGRVSAQLIAGLPAAEQSGSNSKRAKWFAKAWGYEADAGFNRELMTTFFPPVFQASYARADAAAQGSLARGRAMMSGKSPEQVMAEGRWAELVAQAPPAWRWLLFRPTWVTAFAALFVLAFGRSLRTFRMEPGAQPLLRVGGSRYHLYRVAGVISDVQRWNDTTVSPTSTTVSNYDGSTTTIRGFSTVVTKRMQIMIRTDAGKDHDLQLTNMEFPAAVGQRMAAAWAIRGRAKWGPYVLFHNYGLGRTDFLTPLDKILRPSRKPVLLLLAALLLAGVSAGVIVLALVAFGVVVSVVRRTRKARFKQPMADELLAGLRSGAERIELPGGGAITPA